MSDKSPDPITRAVASLTSKTKQHKQDGTLATCWSPEVENVIRFLQSVIQRSLTHICTEEIAKSLDEAGAPRPANAIIGSILGTSGLGWKRAKRGRKGYLFEVPT